MISIIIPCYNYAEFLPEAMESAFNQTFEDKEVIVVNDGSTDNTSEIARECAAKHPEVPFTLIEQVNSGLSAAWNVGIRESKGEYVITLDADDKMDRDYLELAYDWADIVSCAMKTFGEEEKVYGFKENPTFEDMKVNNQVHSCALYKKEIWEKLGGYDESMSGYQDWDFFLRASHAGYQIKVLPVVLFHYRKHGETLNNLAAKNHDTLKQYMLAKFDTKQ